MAGHAHRGPAAHGLVASSSFYVGEERVTADLAPFVLAAPSGEIEAFLATQLVDEMRHAVFFDRWAAEVMALEPDDMRSRLQEIEDRDARPWHFLFDDSLRGRRRSGSRRSPMTSSCSSRGSSSTTWSPRGFWR